MKRTIIQALLAMALVACQKDETIAPSTGCGSEQTEVSTSLEFDSLAFATSPSLIFQDFPTAYMTGDTLHARFAWAAAYGGHVKLVWDGRLLKSEPPQVWIRAVFEEYPPYCVDQNIIVDGAWDMSSLKQLCGDGSDVMIKLGFDNSISSTVHYSW